MHRTPHHRVQVLVAGRAVDAPAIRHDPSSYQDQLRNAKSQYGSALCTCTASPLSLVVREREGRLFLAAWPDQASQHALDCPFYSDPLKRIHGAEKAVLREGDRTQVELHHPLRQDNRRAATTRVNGAGSGAGQKQARIEATTEKLHLWGLLHHLWEDAGLNRWHPGWHRDWGFVRYCLRRVAQSTFVCGEPLLQNLYVPPVWTQKHKDEIQHHWQAFVRPLEENHRRTAVVSSAFVIGMVRSLEPVEFGSVLRLHHHSVRFYMSHNVESALARYSRRGWAAVKQLDLKVRGDDKPYVVAALRVEATQSGRMTVVEAVLMRVSPRYIPVNSSYEDVLARLLVVEDRQFVRPLHFDNHTMAAPDFLLRDAITAAETEPGRSGDVGLYVYGASVGAIQKRVAEAADRRYAEAEGMGYWQWDAAVQPQPPPLPIKAQPSEHADTQRKKSQLIPQAKEQP